jgi:outer membrane protein OmpA-like peptidoglycan-associated protein
MRTNKLLVLSMTALLGACATTAPPQELLNARAAYDRAARGPAASLAPADLETARQALAVAERSQDEDPSDAKTRDLAYVAERRAEVAMSMGRTMEARREQQNAEVALKATREHQLSATEQALDLQRRKGSMQAAALAAEQSARASAEARARDAAQRLSALAAIKDEARGTVITLSGSVLFTSGKSELLPSARDRLNQVADVLKEQPELSFTVIGHTDSQGSDDFNRTLSQQRADAVRAYLVSRGVDSSRIRAVGRGESEPIADNTSPEGRANNRRVEIVLSSHGFESDAAPSTGSTPKSTAPAPGTTPPKTPKSTGTGAGTDKGTQP